MMTNKYEAVMQKVEEFYSSYKVREIEKILSRTDWQDKVQEYLRAKAKVDVLEVSIDSKNQTHRCVAYLLENPNDEIVKYFVGNQKYKPAGLTTTVQLSFLCQTDWSDNLTDVLKILEVARITKTADRREILNKVGYPNKPLIFLEHLLNTELKLSLFNTKSKFYNGYNIKQVDVFDAEAEAK